MPTFEIPDPTPTDPYPGYYQLPSGAWAAHDAPFYAKFAKKWQDEYNAQVRALEKRAVKGFEALDSSFVEEVDAKKEMERAKKELQEREEKKAITMGAGGGPAEPKMKINVCLQQHLYYQSYLIEPFLGKQTERYCSFTTSAVNHAQGSI